MPGEGDCQVPAQACDGRVRAMSADDPLWTVPLPIEVEHWRYPRSGKRLLWPKQVWCMGPLPKFPVFFYRFNMFSVNLKNYENFTVTEKSLWDGREP